MDWAGRVADMPPKAATNTPAPVIAATRWRGRNWVCAVSIAIMPTLMPMPVMKRPTANPITPVDRAHSAKPAAATSARLRCTRRTVNRSIASPTGNCASA